MDTSDLYTAVHWTARTSAAFFAAALLSPVLFRASPRRSAELYLAFVFAHTIHFSFVVSLARAGARLFPDGRDLSDAGGWLAMFGIFAFFYALAFLGLAARLGWKQGARWPCIAGKIATSFIGYMYVATYVPLLSRSPWYALPTALITAAVLLDLTRSARARRCLA